jgi:hypothetical protein
MANHLCVIRRAQAEAVKPIAATNNDASKMAENISYGVIRSTPQPQRSMRQAQQGMGYP